MIFFPEKRIEGIFVYVLGCMLTLVNLDKMQNISTLMRKSSKSEGRAFLKLFKRNWAKLGHWLDMVYLPPQGEFCRPYFS